MYPPTLTALHLASLKSKLNMNEPKRDGFPFYEKKKPPCTKWNLQRGKQIASQWQKKKRKISLPASTAFFPITPHSWLGNVNFNEVLTGLFFVLREKLHQEQRGLLIRIHDVIGARQFWSVVKFKNQRKISIFGKKKSSNIGGNKLDCNQKFYTKLSSLSWGKWHRKKFEQGTRKIAIGKRSTTPLKVTKRKVCTYHVSGIMKSLVRIITIGTLFRVRDSSMVDGIRKTVFLSLK